MTNERGFHFGDVVGIIKRRAGLVGITMGVVFLLALLVSSWMPNRYESKAVLLIEPQTISSDLIEPNLEATDINSRLHLIQMQILSRSRLSGIIGDLDVYPEESESMTREEVIELMRSNVGVVPLLSDLEARAGIRKQAVQINTFAVSFRHRDRKLSAAVANHLARSFVDEHIRERTRASTDTSEFIEAELRRLSESIVATEARISEVKTANIGSLPEDMSANQRLHERLMAQLRDVQRQLTVSQSDAAFYGQQVATGATDFDKYRGSAMTPERKLELLRLQLSEFEARRLTEKHPDVIAAKAEIADLVNKAEEKSSENGDSTELSLAQLNARGSQQRSQLHADAARSELNRIQEQLEQVEQRLASTPRVAGQLAGLEREHEHLFSSFQEFSAKRLEAGVAADMERSQKGEKFRVLEDAVSENQATSPNRLIILAMSLVLGLGLGCALAVLAEASDRSFRDARTLQDRIGIPVLASVPEVLLASDFAAKRRKRMIQGVLAAGIAATTLTVSIAGNWYVNGLPGFVKALSGSDDPTAPPSRSE